MSFLKRFRRSAAAPSWRFAPGGLLWRILPAENGLITGEARSEDKSRVAFFCLEERTGTVRWSGKDFGLGWWCGIEGGENGLLFLHGFASPDMPLHRGVHAVQIATGDLLWSIADVRFAFAEKGKVFAEEDGGVLVELDARTGRKTRTLDDRERTDAVGRSGHGLPPGALLFPRPLGVIEREDPEAAALAARECGPGDRAAEPDVMADAGLVIAECSTFVETPGGKKGIRSTIAVIAREGNRVLYREDVGGTEGMHVPDTFFVRDDILVYIRERTTLTGVDLRRLRSHNKGGRPQ